MTEPTPPDAPTMASDPTRDALHAETLAWVQREADVAERQSRNNRYSERARLIAEKQRERAAYAAECVQRVPELEAEVERLRAQVKAQRDQLVEGLRDVWGQFSHPMGDGWAHDGGLSTLSWVAEDLVRLGAFEQHPKRDWFRPVAAATREGTDV